MTSALKKLFRKNYKYHGIDPKKYLVGMTSVEEKVGVAKDMSDVETY